MRAVLEARAVVSLAVSAVVGAIGLSHYPFPSENPVLVLIRLERPLVHAVFAYTYSALWFTSPFFLATILFSGLCIFLPRDGRVTGRTVLPPYPWPEYRKAFFLVLGEQDRRTSPERVAHPTWLTIPKRGLYTGTFIAGAIGSGKTSACLYPYVEQLLVTHAGDALRKAGGLVLEVKGDFCCQVRDILTRHGRADDYIEIGLDPPYRYNPLHNDLEAYALAYGIATLMTNLFGRGKEPFWQQASTNLVKFVMRFTLCCIWRDDGAPVWWMHCLKSCSTTLSATGTKQSISDTAGRRRSPRALMIHEAAGWIVGVDAAAVQLFASLAPGCPGLSALTAQATSRGGRQLSTARGTRVSGSSRHEADRGSDVYPNPTASPTWFTR